MRVPMFWMTLAAVAAIAASPAMGEEWTKQWPVKGQAELRVDVDDGRVIIRGADTGQISARVVTTGWKIGPGEVVVTPRQEGSRVELDVRTPRFHNWIGTNNRSLRVELTVPRNVIANIRTGDGSILAEDLRGSIRLRTGDGSIDSSGLDGKLDAETGDGSIRTRGRFDLLMLRTGDGRIEADVLDGSKMTSGWDVNTGDGHVVVRLPEKFSADLDAHTGDGKVELEFPLETSRLDGGKDVHGKLNGGGPTLRIRTGDGPIRLARL
ncbi:DUF4097 family beta strand repeat-containing protein [uncultured Paludibaculum sp.]|uniref:DUF4097 family beta strand repeat-containing protein n=1 Tax=uncultured Paludibaculum sp. TaxID=1765020 RepID=UPI002AAAEB4B|nr:DUF4097 family beta strand repeat-containing protein [uncultured Paludibaculum sp.]